jgi:hypothetical protein
VASSSWSSPDRAGDPEEEVQAPSSAYAPEEPAARAAPVPSADAAGPAEEAGPVAPAARPGQVRAEDAEDARPSAASAWPRGARRFRLCRTTPAPRRRPAPPHLDSEPFPRIPAARNHVRRFGAAARCPAPVSECPLRASRTPAPRNRAGCRSRAFRRQGRRARAGRGWSLRAPRVGASGHVVRRRPGRPVARFRGARNAQSVHVRSSSRLSFGE